MSSIARNALSYLVWPAILALPLTLTQEVFPSLNYRNVFPNEWYDTAPRDFSYKNTSMWPSPLGLSLGLGAVVVGQFFMLLYFIYFARPAGQHLAEATGKKDSNSSSTTTNISPYVAIQKEGARAYELSEGLLTHLAQPEGFVMLGSYLIGTWMFGLMPKSYYSFTGGINWLHVLLQLLLQDGIQYSMHMIEHVMKGESVVFGYKITWPFNLYANSHKPHHRFTNPRLFDAFNGSAMDTFLMILLPLYITSQIIDANVWSYMAFGSLYANWLTLIHSEYHHPWETLFRTIGLGTAADHHVHHKLFNYNYGHLFMYYDWIFGTYKNPTTVRYFN
jgi:alternative squalene epoxidase